MASDPVATRYAQAAFDAAKEEDRLEETLEQLLFVGQLMAQTPDLRQLMLNPDVDPDDKVAVLDRSLGGGWSRLVRAFVQMVVVAGRAEALPQIAQAIQDLADQAQGRIRATVRTARPLDAATLNRLQARLEAREGKQVVLRAEVAPELLGGLQVVLGHRVIDASVHRQLADLRQRLTSIKVH